MTMKFSNLCEIIEITLHSWNNILQPAHVNHANVINQSNYVQIAFFLQISFRHYIKFIQFLANIIE